MAETNQEEITFPENSIVLLNGTTLDCYPIAGEGEGSVTDNSIRLDTTGQYLSIGSGHPKPAAPEAKDVEAQRALFINNAFYLLAHKERILSDSRMFLCPVYIQSGLAYTGISGFRKPTIGVYIEWWLNCPGAMQVDEQGRRQIVYRIAGSPLSGSNRCGAICENGDRETVFLSQFNSHWRPFIEINNRYDEAKRKYQAYTLQQVLDILRQEEDGSMDYAQIIETDFMKHEVMTLRKKVQTLQKESDRWYRKYCDTVMKYNDQAIRELYAAYEGLKAEVNAEMKGLKAQKKELKSRLKSKQLDNIEYQHQVMPLNKRIHELELKLLMFKNDRVSEILPHDNITFSMIEERMKRGGEKGSDHGSVK